jgi:GT2 family glycosyltransferase
LFNRFGLFDEELIRNQDDEFNLRLARAGGKIWQSPRIRSHYRPRESVRSLFQQYLQYGYWKVRVIQKHTKPASIRHILPASFILLLFLSFALWPWWALAGRTFLGSIAFYLAANAAASLLTALRNRWDMFLVLPMVFGCYHFGYGVGFLQGIWDFMILKRGPSPFYTGLTRPVSPPQPRATI